MCVALPVREQHVISWRSIARMARPYLRHPAKIDGDFVVFLIGARLVKPWLFWKIIPVARAMSAMQKELEQKPELGCLGREDWGARTTISVQYWRSREHLMSYARQRDAVRTVNARAQIVRFLGEQAPRERERGLADEGAVH